MEPANGLISARESAKRLGISRSSLSRLVKNNRIGVYRVGGRTMFDETILDAYKRSVFVQPTKEESGQKE
jgi:excisionase family DNA binding protein